MAFIGSQVATYVTYLEPVTHEVYIFQKISHVVELDFGP